jgi:hypothetical protein
MDLTPTIVPKSDQLNAEDFLAGPQTVTIKEVAKGNAEQPVNIVTEQFGPRRPYKPSKSMRRVMVAAWGPDTSTYTGRALTLYRDPEVRFAGEPVGGIRIAAMSHLIEPLEVALTVTRGHRSLFIVQPIATEQPKDESGRDWLVELSDTQGDLDAISALGAAAAAAHANETALKVIRSAYLEAKASGQAELEEQK